MAGSIGAYARKQKAQALAQAKRLPEAKAILTKVCKLDARDAEAWLFLGAVNGQMGLFEQTIECCYKAVSLRTGYVDALATLGNTLKRVGRLDEAANVYRQVLRYQPDHVQVHYRLGLTMHALNKMDDAVVSYRDALRIQPDYAEAHNNLANVLYLKGELEQAAEHCREALRLRPDFVEAYGNLGNVLKQQGRYIQAAECCYKALELRPDFAGLHNNLACLLQNIGMLDKAVEAYREAIRLMPDYVSAHNDMMLCLNYLDTLTPEEVFEEHRAWARLRTGSIELQRNHENNPDPERRLRVGYVSPDLWNHSVAWYFQSLVTYHTLSKVETFCYADVKRPDTVTERLRELADHWRDIRGMDDEAVAELIQWDGIDILVDLAGHTADSRLRMFARKPAPIQVSWLGYPNTTGLEAMDYRLTDAWADPPGKTEQWHTETLVRLPHGFLCYQPPPDLPPVGPLPLEQAGYVTFGSFNNLAKVTPRVVALWARILDAVPGSRLILKNKSFRDPGVRERYYDLFVGEGIERDRLELCGFLPQAEHFGLYGRIDIGLDTFPYSGTTTTCEALWMGVPVITLAGDCHAGRVGVSLLSQLGLEDFIAGSPEAYVERAVLWAGRSGELAALRAGLRERMISSPLCDAGSFAGDIEDAYREMRRTWCEDRPK